MAELQNLDANLGLAIEAFNGANVELDRIEGELDVNARHLVVARKSLNVAQRRVATRLRDLYVNGESDSTLDVILGASSLDDVITRLEAIQRVSSQDTSILREVKRFRRDVERHRAQLKDARANQEDLVADRAAQRAAIEEHLGERQRLLASVKDEIVRPPSEDLFR